MVKGKRMRWARKKCENKNTKIHILTTNDNYFTHFATFVCSSFGYIFHPCSVVTSVVWGIPLEPLTVGGEYVVMMAGVENFLFFSSQIHWIRCTMYIHTEMFLHFWWISDYSNSRRTFFKSSLHFIFVNCNVISAKF